MDQSKLNPHFQQLAVDYLYHLGLDSSMDLKKMFGDVKYVVLTRSFSNADYFANQFAKAYYKINDLNIDCQTIAKDERFHTYKIANTLVISHGVGYPSMLICLNEVVKLLWHAKVADYTFFRLSSGGGLNVAENSVIIANQALNHEFKPLWSNIEFGDSYSYATPLSHELAQQLAINSPDISTTCGGVMASGGFYNAQARLNGALALNYTAEQRYTYLTAAYQAGVCGIDLESSCFAAFCHNFQIPASVVLAALADRLKNSDIEPSLMVDSDNLSPVLKQAGQVIINYILKNSSEK